jgi:transposase
MTIPAELEAQILRYHYAEHWPVNTIARQLRVHHSTVARVLARSGVPRADFLVRASAIDPYVPFLLETLTRFPTLTAARLYVMAKERGYTGCASQFRHRISLIRPRKPAEAYLRLRTLAGEQAQVDWAHFGHLTIGRARRPLMAFVMVLSYSRRIYLHFFLDARMSAFLAGHVGAFAAFGGVARILLYDNLKTAVLERHGPAIRFHPTLLAFAAHHRYEPRPVAVARGNEKGRVERAIRYARDAFFAARAFRDLADLNDQAAAWCAGEAMNRPWPEDTSLTVRDAFVTEQPRLLALPDDTWPVDDRIEVAVRKTPYVRFDGNDYSVPHTHVQRSLTVLADTQRVRIADGASVLAEHGRCYDRGQQIEIGRHVQDLVDAKRAARRHRTTDALVRAIPAVEELLVRAAARNYRLASVVSALSKLLDQYPVTEVATAVAEALQHDVPHPNAVRNILDRRRQARGAAPPVVVLPDHLKQRDVRVRIHPLATYDQLKESRHGDPEDPDESA